MLSSKCTIPSENWLRAAFLIQMLAHNLPQATPSLLFNEEARPQKIVMQLRQYCASSFGWHCLECPVLLVKSETLKSPLHVISSTTSLLTRFQLTCDPPDALGAAPHGVTVPTGSKTMHHTAPYSTPTHQLFSLRNVILRRVGDQASL